MSKSSIYKQLFEKANIIYRDMNVLDVSYLNDKKSLNQTETYFLGRYGLLNYVFFDGKEIRKIDNFPDSEELNNKYETYIKELKYLFAYRNMEFIRYTFFGIRPTHFSWLKNYRYSKITKKWVEQQKLNEKVYTDGNGVVHISGNPTYIELGIYNSLMKNKLEIDFFGKKRSLYPSLKFKKNFRIPRSLVKYLHFDGKEIHKKDIFPRILERKYNRYICDLEYLYKIFIICQVSQITGDYRVVSI